MQQRPVKLPLFVLVIFELPEVPFNPMKEIRFPEKEVLSMLVILIVGFFALPVMPAPLKVRVSLLK
jgi:hypothetical protein